MNPTSGARGIDRSYERRMTLGHDGEQIVRDHVIGLGWQIVAMNMRCARGEIDIVSRDGGQIVICEVKTLRGPDAALDSPLESIGERKRLRVRRTAAAWLAGAPAHDADHRVVPRPLRAIEVRFDAFGVVIDRDGDSARIEHVRNAF